MRSLPWPYSWCCRQSCWGPRPPRGKFVTGGVASSLGKGLTASSLGSLLKARGLRVTMQKLDPYLNVDPGTMNPFQHGEVFVTDDGAETDLDVGHYERFLDTDLHGSANVTTGQVYSRSSPRSAAANTSATPSRSSRTSPTRSRAASAGWPPDDVDVVITEVGGTVGDIESLPFLEAVRQVRHEVGRDNVFFLHVSLVPYIGPSGELKTKPTQHSVAALRNVGIQPDAIVCRSDRPIPRPASSARSALMCDVDEEAVVAAADARVDLRHPQGAARRGPRRLRRPPPRPAVPRRRLDRVGRPAAPGAPAGARPVTVALVGKYVDLPDAYLSVTEALRAGGFANDAKVDIRWVDLRRLRDPRGRGAGALDGVDGVLVPGGFGVRGIEGKLGALALRPRERRSRPSGSASACSAW